MKIVFNSSPLIFLSRLGFLEAFLLSSDEFYMPLFVSNEINAKQDQASEVIQGLIDSSKIQVRTACLTSLVNSLNQRLGKGEAEAIALGIELQTDYIILDDFAARREAMRLGLSVKGTLAIIKKLRLDGKITIDDVNQLYQRLVEINFRVKRSLFDAIFAE